MTAAHLDGDLVVTVGIEGWIYRWEFSRPWEVVERLATEAR